MANNVYIGSRYVPIFDGTWSNSKSYEPLTIVEYGNSSYTSKRQVPAGTLPTNTTYWALTGNYNGQIADLQSEVNNLNVAKNNYLHSNIICIGDSYIQTDPNNSWAKFLSDKMPGSTFHTRGIGNTGFVGIHETETFQTMLAYIINNLTSAQKAAITDVIVLGGLNDATAIKRGNVTVDGVVTAIDNFVLFARNNLPNAKVHIGYCGWMAQNFDIRDDHVPYQINALTAYRRCSRNGICSYITDIEYIMPFLESTSTYYRSDWIHPTSATSNIIAASLLNYLLSGAGIKYTRASTGNMTTVGFVKAGNVTSFTNNNLKYFVDNNMLNIRGGEVEFLFNNATISTNAYFDIATIPYDPIKGSTTNPIYLLISVLVMPGNNNKAYSQHTGMLRIRNGAVQLKLYAANNNAFENVTRLILQIPSIALDPFNAC